MTLRRVALALLAAAALAALAGYSVFTRWLDAPLAIGPEPLTVDIPRGQPHAATTRQLADTGALRHPRWLQASARFSGADARLKAGEYSVPPDTTPRGLLRLLESGAVVQHAVTIVERWSFRDLRGVLEPGEGDLLGIAQAANALGLQLGLPQRGQQH